MIVKYFLCAIALGSAARALTEIAEKCQQEIEEEIFKINKRFGDDDTECVDEGKLEDVSDVFSSDLFQNEIKIRSSHSKSRQDAQKVRSVCHIISAMKMEL